MNLRQIVKKILFYRINLVSFWWESGSDRSVFFPLCLLGTLMALFYSSVLTSEDRNLEVVLKWISRFNKKILRWQIKKVLE